MITKELKEKMSKEVLEILEKYKEEEVSPIIADVIIERMETLLMAHATEKSIELAKKGINKIFKKD